MRIVVGLAASRGGSGAAGESHFSGGLPVPSHFVSLLAVTGAVSPRRVGLTLAGGILLLWARRKMYRELRHGPRPASAGAAAVAEADSGRPLQGPGFWGRWCKLSPPTSRCRSIMCLPVAGAAKGHMWCSVVGLGIVVVLMAVAANYIAKLPSRLPWITWIGLLIILYCVRDRYDVAWLP